MPPTSGDQIEQNARQTGANPSLLASQKTPKSVEVVSEHLEDGFDTGRSEWQVSTPGSHRTLQFSQRSNRELAHSGTAAAEIRIASNQAGRVVRLEYALPPSRVIDDLTLSIWLRSNQSGIQLALRIVLPNQRDPETGEVLTTFVSGDSYENPSEWQRLEAKTLAGKVRKQIQFLRARFRPVHIDDTEMFVDRVILEFQTWTNETVVLLDEMRFGPMIAPTNIENVAEFEKAAASVPSAEFRLDQLFVDGHPAFPRIVPYHGETPEELKACGASIVLVPDWKNTQLLSELRKNGLWAMATPPHPFSVSGGKLDRTDTSLAPFSDETSPILAWYLGTRISSEASNELTLWLDQVRSADRCLQRPIVADIAGAERVLSRHLSMTGISRHVINTSFGLRQYRNWLEQKRRLARPGSFVWTWIQTEPAPQNRALLGASKRPPPTILYEQIRLQVYAALAAGYHGIGYWSRSPIDETTSAAQERKLAITQLNLELELLEPWLSTGTLVDQIPFEIVTDETLRPGQTPIRVGGRKTSLIQQISGLHNSQSTVHASQNGNLQAAVIRSGNTFLLLPIWYERDAQFVPGSLAARNVRIVVPGVPDTSFVWEVTTTRIKSLPSERVTGGIAFLLPDFDQTAAVLITSNYELGRILQNKIEGLSARSARVLIELARIKLDRVERVNEELNQLGVGQSHAPQWLGQTRKLIQRAETLYQRAEKHDSAEASSPTAHVFRQQDYDEARQWSNAAMQLLRILQRAHWVNAVRDLSSPVSSQYTVNFDTLPDYWRMVKQIGNNSTNATENLLVSGSFDGIAPGRLIEEGWQHEQAGGEGIRAAAELALVSGKNNYALRLVAGPETNVDPPKVLVGPPVRVTTPRFPVKRGQLVHATGAVRVTTPITSSLEGVTVQDNLSGRAGALQWTKPQSWQQFEVIRDVHADSEFSLTFTLHGLGEVLIDDVRIVVLSPPGIGTEPADRQPDSTKKTRSGALDFLNRLPTLNSWKRD